MDSTVCPLIYIHCLQVAITTPKGRSYRQPTQPRKGWPYHRGLRPLLFSNNGFGFFTSYKNQISESAVKRDLRFFVLIREEQKV